MLANRIECVRELYFSASIGACLGDGFPNVRFQNGATKNAEPRWRVVSSGFLHQAGNADRSPGLTHHGVSDLDYTEALHILWFDLANGNN